MPVPAPHRFVKPAVTINSTDSICHFSMVNLIPTQEFVDVETYCNPGGEAPGKVSWRANLRVRMSYGTDSAWTFFSALVGAAAAFELRPDAATVGTGNPEASFSAYIPALPFIPEHAIGESATFDLECRVIGEPVFANT